MKAWMISTSTISTCSWFVLFATLIVPFKDRRLTVLVLVQCVQVVLNLTWHNHPGFEVTPAP